jgi:hypothetical protein
MTVPTAMQLLQGFAIEFTDAIDADRARGFERLVGWVRLQLPVAASGPFSTPSLPPLVALHCRTGFTQSGFFWILSDPPATVQNLLVNGALIVIDLDCDYIFDLKGRPVSGSGAAILGGDTFAPGGIFRTWIQVQPG